MWHTFCPQWYISLFACNLLFWVTYDSKCPVSLWPVAPRTLKLESWPSQYQLKIIAISPTSVPQRVGFREIRLKMSGQVFGEIWSPSDVMLTSNHPPNRSVCSSFVSTFPKASKERQDVVRHFANGSQLSLSVGLMSHWQSSFKIIWKKRIPMRDALTSNNNKGWCTYSKLRGVFSGTPQGISKLTAGHERLCLALGLQNFPTETDLGLFGTSPWHVNWDRKSVV